MPKVPNFLIIGAPKAASTSLWASMRQHPEVFMPEIKEPRYFSHAESYERGWDWYTSLFSEAGDCRAIGEASPQYCLVNVYPGTADRIAEKLPEAKLIYCVREPFSAIESYWRQICYSGESLPNRHQLPVQFEKAVRTFQPLLEIVRYWSNLEAYRRHFSDDQILVVFFEEWCDDSQLVLKQCFRFLGVDPHFGIAERNYVHNSSSVKTRMLPSWIHGLRRSPVAALLKRTLPARTRRRLSDAMLRRIPKPEWNERIRAHLHGRLQDEVTALLQHCDRVPEKWNRHWR